MDRTDELNSRIFERNNISNNLNIRFDPRSLSTKYTLPQSINELNNFKNLTSDNKIGSLDEYAEKINDESILRNQIYPLQNCSSNQYIPDKNSDLYNYEMTNTNNPTQQLFPGLFKKNIFSNTGNSENSENLENLENDKKQLFNNDTRQQLKNS